MTPEPGHNSGGIAADRLRSIVDRYERLEEEVKALRKRNRTGRERLAAIPAAIARGEEFRQRVRDAAGDAVRLADLMAEAIAMDRDMRGLDFVGRDGRTVFGMESLQAAYALDAARAAYLNARGANHS